MLAFHERTDRAKLFHSFRSLDLGKYSLFMFLFLSIEPNLMVLMLIRSWPRVEACGGRRRTILQSISGWRETISRFHSECGGRGAGDHGLCFDETIECLMLDKPAMMS